MARDLIGAELDIRSTDFVAVLNGCGDGRSVDVFNGCKGTMAHISGSPDLDAVLVGETLDAPGPDMPRTGAVCLALMTETLMD